jgi:hypothetical protein
MSALKFVSLAAIAAAGLTMGQSAFAQDAGGKLFFEGDMVRGHTQDGATGPSCVLTSEFKRGESVVWRVRVLNDKGEPLGEDGLTNLAVQISGGDTFDMGYGWHPRQGQLDQFWATSWRVPKEYPTGTLAYKIVATLADGSTQTWEPFKIPASQLTVIDGDVTYTK